MRWSFAWFFFGFVALLLFVMQNMALWNSSHDATTKQSKSTSKRSTTSPQFVHVINVYDTENERSVALQRLALACIKRAQSHASEISVRIVLAAASDARIRWAEQDAFNMNNTHVIYELHRSAHDVVTPAANCTTCAATHTYAPALPMVSEILQVAAQHADSAPWLIFTNTDLLVARDFYRFIAAKAARRRDRRGPTLDITRRDVSIDARTQADIARTFASTSALLDASAVERLIDRIESERGQLHPGRDTWLLPTTFVSKLELSDLFLGFRYAMPLAVNLQFWSRHHTYQQHEQVTDAFVTRHIVHSGGADRNALIAYQRRDEMSRVMAIATLHQQHGDEFEKHCAKSATAPYARVVQRIVQMKKRLRDKSWKQHVFNVTVLHGFVFDF